MTFSVTVLGSSAAIPANNRNLNAHLLNANERFFLIDCGEGTQFQLRRCHISMMRINHIFISHLHGDHFYGLVGLINSMHLLGRKNDLHVFAHPALKEILDIQFSASMTVLRFSVLFHPLRFDSPDLLYEDKHLSVRSFPLKHSIPTCGFIFREINPPRKLTEARSFAYCSDTAYTEDIIPFINGAGLLFHEATFLQAMAGNATATLHATAQEAATIALKAGVKKLLIGHFSARYEEPGVLLDEARALFPETYIAEEGVAIHV